MIVTQEQVDQMIVQLAEQVRASEQHFDRIVGIERGGLYISLTLSKMLDLSHESIYISCYKDMVKRAKPIIYGTLPIGGWSLLVDDIVDSGETVRMYNQHCGPQFKVAALHWNPKSSIKPDFYAAKKLNEWLTYPWELAYEN